MSGYIKIHRRILDNPISTKPNYLAVWLYILANACHKDTPYILNNEKIIIPRGCFYGSMQKIAQHFKLSTGAVHKIINYFESDNMLNTKRTRNYTLFQVLNYDKFQDREHAVNTLNSEKEKDDENCEHKVNTSDDQNDLYNQSVNGQEEDDGEHKVNTKSPPREHAVKQKKKVKKEKNIEKINKKDFFGDLPDCIDPDIWSEWIEHKNQIRSKITPLAAKRQVASLVEWYSQGYDPNVIITQSITNGWRGLFKPKENTGKSNKITAQVQELLQNGW